jgi:transcriptional regulator with XRE-family HTH domain
MPDRDFSAFARYLRELRKKRDMTLRDLGDVAGLDFTYLSKIENDAVSVPSENAIIRLATALRATPAETAKLIEKSNQHRETPIESKVPESREAELLVRRIYKGDLTARQMRQMLDLVQNQKGSSRRKNTRAS